MATLPVFIPLSEAARKYGLDEDYLRQMVERGKIRAAMVAGEMVVSEDEVREVVVTRKEDLPEYKKHQHLRGMGISLPNASEKYGLNPSTIYRWFKKGIISEVSREIDLGGERILYDEADIAYCAEIYRRKGKQGRKIFDEKGIPYVPKNGALAG